MTSTGASGATPPVGAPMPSGIGGAVADGAGEVRLASAPRAGGLDRLRAALDAATTGMPMPTATGELPAGVHHVAWNDVASAFAGNPRRSELATQLAIALNELHEIGVQRVLVGGSFVGAKSYPGDVDVAVISHDRAQSLTAREMTSAVAPFANEVHVYPAEMPVANAATMPGVRAGETFAELFSHDRSGAARGVLLLDTMPRSIADAAIDALERAARTLR